MHRDPQPYLHDALLAADAIQDLVRGKSVEDYLADPLLRAAVERQFIVLGEALYQLRTHFPRMAYDIPDIRHVISFRHVLVHGYNQVEPDIAWGVIESMLQGVKEKVRTLLEETPAP